MSASPPLEVRGLTKRYGKTTAVEDLTFAIAPGRITGFLGPNGAGKTTTLRILLGLVHASSGEALVEGSPYRKLADPLRTVGAVLEASNYHPTRSGRNHLRVLASAAGIPTARVDEALEEVDLPVPAGGRVEPNSPGWPHRLREEVVRQGVEATPTGPDGLRASSSPERIGEIAAANGLVLHELRSEVASLEEVFLELTGGER